MGAPHDDDDEARSGLAERAWVIAGWALLASACHLLTSDKGFFACDAGVVFAQARRLLDGQFPHRDFISIRPVGSGLLHMVELVVSRDHADWLGKWTWWLQVATIARLAVSVMERALRVSLPRVDRELIGGVGFVAAVNSVFRHPWHSVDALMCTMLGAYLLQGRRALSHGAGALVLGYAVLCRQNFLPVLPAVLWATGHARSAERWLQALLPLAAYVLLAQNAGAMPDVVMQLAARADFFEGAIRPWLVTATFTGVALGAGIHFARWALTRAGAPRPAVEGLALATIAALQVGMMARYTTIQVHLPAWAFISAGAAAGTLLVSWSMPGLSRAATLAFIPAWATSISLGFATPRLAFGVTWALQGVALAAHLSDAIGARIRRIVLVAGAGGMLLFWPQGAYLNVPGDTPRNVAIHPLEGVLPGLHGVHTGPLTYLYASELARLVDHARAEHRVFAILPDLPGFWAASPERNPLPADWTATMELADPLVVDRVNRAVHTLPPGSRFFVARVQASTLMLDVLPLPVDYSATVTHIRAACSRVRSGVLWDTYECE